jgi:hypothetical protein
MRSPVAVRYEASDRSARSECTRDANHHPPDTPMAGGLLLPAPPSGARRHSLRRRIDYFLGHENRL